MNAKLGADNEQDPPMLRSSGSRRDYLSQYGSSSIEFTDLGDLAQLTAQYNSNKPKDQNDEFDLLQLSSLTGSSKYNLE